MILGREGITDSDQFYTEIQGYEKSQTDCQRLVLSCPIIAKSVQLYHSVHFDPELWCSDFATEFVVLFGK